MPNLMLFGPPGSGKGTQSSRLAQHYGLVHMDAGALLRSHIAQATPLGKAAESYIQAGKMAPHTLVVDMVRDFVGDHAHAKGFVFDGFPRTLDQAAAFKDILQEANRQIDKVFWLDVDEEALRKRIRLRSLSSGRLDDQDEDKVTTRLQVYLELTLPVAKTYPSCLVHINGMEDMDTVFAAICQHVDAVDKTS